MTRIASLVTIGLLAAGLGAADESIVRVTLHGASPDHDLDFGGLVSDVDGSWDVALRGGVEFLAIMDRFAGVDLAMGVGLYANWAQEDDIDVETIAGNGSMDTRMVGASGRFYAGIATSGAFGFEALPYVGVGVQDLRWEIDGVTAGPLSDVDYMWDLGTMLNLTTRIGEHWQLGLSGSVFYRAADFDYTLNVGNTGISYQQFGFEYGLIGGIRF